MKPRKIPEVKTTFATDANLIDELYAKLDPNTDVAKLTSSFNRNFTVKPQPQVLDEEGQRLRRLMKERSLK